MTVMVDTIVGPDGRFVPGTSVRVRLVASSAGEGAGADPSTFRTIEGVFEKILQAPLFVLDLTPNEDPSFAPANTVYEIVSRSRGRPNVPRTFTAPVPPTPTLTTDAISVPALDPLDGGSPGGGATETVDGGGPTDVGTDLIDGGTSLGPSYIPAATDGFPASGLLWIGDLVVSYTSKTDIAFVGCEFLNADSGAAIPVGSVVEAAYWIPQQQDDPPANLPTLHSGLTHGAHGIADTSKVPQTDLVAAITAEWSFRKGTAGTDPEAFRSFGAGTDNDAITAALGQISDDGGGHLVLRRPYDVHKLVLPTTGPVSIHGHDPEVCMLRNLDTDGGGAASAFIKAHGTGLSLEGIGIDARRDAQTVTTGNALQIVKPNGVTGGGSISGGMLLTSPVAAGATSLTVASAAPGGVAVRASDVITLAQAGQFEIVRVARSYSGGTTIPLSAPTQYAWPTSANVCVALDRPILEGLLVFGLFVAVSLWHVYNARIVDVRCPDFLDTGIDIEGGSHGVTVVDPYCETSGRFGISVDDDPAAVDQLGPVSDITLRGAKTRFASAGASPQHSIFISVCQDVVIEGGTADLRAAGDTGIYKNAARAQRLSVDGFAVIGPPAIRPDTFGLKTVVTPGDEALPTGDLTVRGMNIRNVQRGIEGHTSRSLVACENLIANVSDYGINMTGGGSAVQHLASIGNRVDGCIVGVRGGGTPAAGSTVHTRADVVYNASFLPVVADPGWTLDSS